MRNATQLVWDYFLQHYELVKIKDPAAAAQRFAEYIQESLPESERLSEDEYARLLELIGRTARLIKPV